MSVPCFADVFHTRAVVFGGASGGEIRKIQSLFCMPLPKKVLVNSV